MSIQVDMCAEHVLQKFNSLELTGERTVSQKPNFINMHCGGFGFRGDVKSPKQISISQTVHRRMFGLDLFFFSTYEFVFVSTCLSMHVNIQCIHKYSSIRIQGVFFLPDLNC